MSAESHRLSLSRKRKRNVSSYSSQVEVIDVDEELSYADKNKAPRDGATLSERHTRLCEDYTERLENGIPQPQTVSSEVVDCDHAPSSTNCDVEHLLVEKSDEHVDDFDIYSQDWRVWNPQSVSKDSLMSKKQTKLHSFFSCTPTARRGLHSSSASTTATTTSPRENKKHNSFSSSSTHVKVKLDKLQNSKPAETSSSDAVDKSQTSKPTETSSDVVDKLQDSKPTETSSSDAINIKSCGTSSLDAGHLVVDNVKLPASLDVGKTMVSRSGRPERSVSSQGSTPSSSQQLKRSQSGAITSVRRRVCPQYKWIPGTMILLADVQVGICNIHSNLATLTVQALWVWLCNCPCAKLFFHLMACGI